MVVIFLPSAALTGNEHDRVVGADDDPGVDLRNLGRPCDGDAERNTEAER